MYPLKWQTHCYTHSHTALFHTKNIYSYNHNRNSAEVIFLAAIVQCIKWMSNVEYGKMVSVVFLTITILTFIRPFLLSLLFIFGPFFPWEKKTRKSTQNRMWLYREWKHFRPPKSYIQNAICILSSISVRFRSSHHNDEFI